MIGIAFFVIIAITVFPAVTMLLWNWLIPTLFSGPVITYWQALGLIVLAKILFSSGPGGCRSDRHSHSAPWKAHLRHKMELKHNQEIPADEVDSSKPADTENE
jgi:hypothetical protein